MKQKLQRLQKAQIYARMIYISNNDASNGGISIFTFIAQLSVSHIQLATIKMTPFDRAQSMAL